MTVFPCRASTSDFADRLVAWYRRRGRELPWRRGCDPYRVWVSEIMLQQTGVAAVIPFFERFLARFPDLETLAAADSGEVIELWAGLGYYSRARNLHAAAEILLARHQGKFPQELSELMGLPGVGRSTAGAILALAFGQRAPILDGNVRRILCRLFALEEAPTSAASQKRLWQWAEELTPCDNVYDYSQAIMDLGAMVCTPKNPDCGSCPVKGFCCAFRLGKVAQFPVAVASKKVPTVRQVALVLEYQGCLLLRKRPYQGFLGGLWEFPNGVVAEEEESGGVAQRLLREFGLQGGLRPCGEIRHAYSHFRLIAEILAGQVDPLEEQIAEEQDSARWFSAEAVAALPIHGAHRKIAARFEAGAGGFDAAGGAS